MNNFLRDFKIGLGEGFGMFFRPWVAAATAFTSELTATRTQHRARFDGRK